MLDRVSHCLLIEDSFEGAGEHLFEIFFHFFPGIRVDRLAASSFHALASASEIQVDFIGEQPWLFEVRDGFVSERYGRKRESRKLVAASRQVAPCRLTTVVRLGAQRSGEPWRQVVENRMSELQRRLAEFPR